MTRAAYFLGGRIEPSLLRLHGGVDGCYATNFSIQFLFLFIHANCYFSLTFYHHKPQHGYHINTK